MAGKASFNWEDPLLLDTQLTEEERMVRDSAHAYAQEKLLPRIKDAFRHETTDPSVFPEMGALGLLGATLPAEFWDTPGTLINTIKMAAAIASG